MNYLLQLRLLLWKNFTLRKRHWVRLLIELVWPLMLFLILVLVRTRGLRKYHQQCFFDEKAMPSAGLLTFARSFICTFNNTCHLEPPKPTFETPAYSDSFITEVVTDVENALERNFNRERVDTLTRIFKDFYTIQQVSQDLGRKFVNGESIKGLSIDPLQSVLQNPDQFREDLVKWALGKGIVLDPDEIRSFLQAKLTPERVTPVQLVTMLSDPRTAICDPDIVSKLVEPRNMTNEEVKASIRPLCNLSLDEALELVSLVRSAVDWNKMQNEAENFAVEVTGGYRINFTDYETLYYASEDVRRDLLQKQSIKKVIGDVSDFLRQMSKSMTMDIDSDADLANTSNSLFARNMSSNARLAFAAFQRVVCGRNMSSDQLFSDGGAATHFDELRDQLKEKDEEFLYMYDNTTSKECNSLMKSLEENKLTRFLWDQIKPFIRGKILFTPDTPATRRIIGLVNATFAPIEDVRRLAHTWVNSYSERVRGLFMDKENQDFIKQMFTRDDEGSLLDLFLSSNITKSLNEEGEIPLLEREELMETLQDYFKGNFSANWTESFDMIDNFMGNLSTYLSCFDFNKFVPVKDEHTLEVEGIRLISENKLWAGVVFVDLPAGSESDRLPEFIRYKIRLDSDKVDSTRYIEDRISRPGPRRRPGIDLKYLYFGFAYLQDMLEHSIISVQSGRSKMELPGVTLQQMPYPCYIEDRFIIAIARTFPLFMTLAWIYSASMIIKSIVYEKEQRLKETMRVMGLGNGVHWISWFIDSFCIMTLSAFMLTIILCYGDILTKSDPSVVFCFMLSYTVATIALCFLLTTFFSRANIAAAAGGILFFMFYLPYSLMVVWEETLSPNVKIISCLISNIAFGFGCAYFSHFEESGEGAQWSNIWVSPVNGDAFSMAGSIGMLIIDSAVYFIATWYIEAVWPGQYGVPKPWYFFLTKSYWIGSQRAPGAEENQSLSSNSITDPENGSKNKFVEDEPTHLGLGISVRHLSKVYSNGKVAIEDLNLNFYEGQITSFLGHNGAGKTTTISILTGLLPPSSGTALINGLDIRKDMDSIRKSLGTCPQHNVLFDYLTVYEHLWFYARLKDKDPDVVQEEANAMIEDLGLPHKRNEVSKNLSGGMQRKLSVALAFVGGSKTVVLDEPTAGVDPHSRRSIWDLLSKYKDGRTVILTTHFMDEADLLGDRIAIINNGKLVCVGSSLFLRVQYGNGYYLTLVKEDAEKHDEQKEEGTIIEEEMDNSSAQNDSYDGASQMREGDEGSRRESELLTVKAAPSSASSDSIENDIIIDDEGVSDIARENGIVINPSKANEHAINYPTTKFIQKYVPSARLLEQIGSEIIYVLPTDDQRIVKRFEYLFTELDRYKERLKIKSYGLSDTTLEEIFLKVASNAHDGEIIRHFEDGTDFAHVANRVRSASESSGMRLFFDNLNRKKKIKSTSDADEFPNNEVNLNERKVLTSEGRSISYTQVPDQDDAKVKIEPESSPKKRDFSWKTEQSATSLFWAHIKALEIKRFHHSRRNRKGLLCEILLPAIFVCLAMIFTLIMPPLEEQKPIELHPWMYPSSGEGSLHTFYSNSNPDADWPKRYEEQLLSRTGMGTRCISPGILPSLKPCKDKEPDPEHLKNPPDLDLDNIETKECSCAIGTQTCPVGAAGPDPPRVQMASYDILYNLTGRNIPEYLMKTRQDFYKKRYGGFEFGIRNPLAKRNISQLEEVTNRWLKATNEGEDRLDPTVRALIFGNLEDLSLSSSVFDNVRVWFNNKGWAASMAYMNAINNIILRASIQGKEDNWESFTWDTYKDPSIYGMSVVNHPMNFTREQLDVEVIRQIGISLLHAICVIFAMSFVPASFVIFHIEERVSKVKHLQFVSGVKTYTYWIAAFLWDICMFLFTALLCIIIFLAFDAKAYVSEENFPSLVILMFLYGFSTIAMMYPACFIFSIPSTAFVSLSCLNLFAGIITTVTTFVLENFEDDELQYIGTILKEVFLILPHYCLGRGLMDMATEMNINLIVSRFGFVSDRNRFSWDFLGKYMVSMTLQGILWFTVTLLIEHQVWKSIKNLCSGKNQDAYDPSLKNEIKSDEDEEDEDVRRERERIMSKPKNPWDVLQVRELFKRYEKMAKPAVNRLTFGVKRGECFGLLGVNGAGKTTTFKMLTGDTEPTAGDALLNGFSIINDLQKVRQSLGYCPQFDALNPLLTGREHLSLYARLRGLDEDTVKKVADWGLKKLGLIPYADRCAGTYSGGNKRKLQTAIALVGNPSVVFLDEPTTGMDPGARRFLWNCILERVRAGQSVVLTSHSMEECEALCTRLGIMVNGKFQCLGSAQHLKNRFGSGYTLTLRATANHPDAIWKLKELVIRTFPLAELKEEHYNMLQYQLPLTHTKLPVVFREMEKAKAKPHESFLEDYTITQTTLDEVFIRFASKQTESGVANSECLEVPGQHHVINV